MRRIRYPRATAIYFSIAMTMMIVIKLFVIGDIKHWKDLPMGPGDKTVVVAEDHLYQFDSGTLPQSMRPDMFMSEPDEVYLETMRLARLQERAKKIQKAPYVPPVVAKGRSGRIVIIIDDMGMNRTNSHAAIDLPNPLTLAFLPYAPKLSEITGRARKKGHELMIHVPMEPMSSKIDPGPMALKDGMTEEVLRLNLSKIFQSFDGYAGINNHMGSKLTQDENAMRVVMKHLVDQDLFFVDSKTSAQSVAGDMAAAHGLRYAQRDVFLDHEDTPEFVAHALRNLERIAYRRGIAIGIGHPKKNTIDALKRWIPTLKDKNLTLVPVSKVVKRKSIRIGSDDSPRLPQKLQKIEPATY